MNSETSKSQAISSLKIDPSLREPQRSTGRGRFGFWVIFLLLLFAAAGGYVWAHSHRIPKAEVVQVTRMRTSGRDSTILAASGYVEPRRQATVSSKITGQVIELLVEEGMEVKQGQVLARLDDAEANAQLESALSQEQVAQATLPELQIRLEEATRNWERVNLLFEKGGISEEIRDQAQTSRDSLQAQLEVARQQLTYAGTHVEIARRHLENFTIRAPFSGIAISKDAQIGEIISPVSAGGGFTRTGISTIVDMSSLEIEVDVNESYIARVAPSQRVVAVLDAYPDWEIPASVRTIIPSADRQKATVKVRIAFDQLDPRILPDMGVKVSFLTVQEAASTDSSNAEPILWVDARGILGSDAGAPYALICGADQLLEFRPVKTGKTLPRGVEILSGLNAGDWIVVDPSGTLQGGQRIQPIRP